MEIRFSIVHLKTFGKISNPYSFHYLECATHLTETYGIIRSPKFISSKYFDESQILLDCQWLIQLLPEDLIEMKFIDFDLGTWGSHDPIVPGNCQ